MTISLDTIYDVHRTWALPALKQAQKAFNREPNGQNWTLCVKAMLVHQQLEWAIRSTSVDKGKMLFDFESNPVGAWPDVVFRATLGMDASTAMREFTR